MNTNPDIEIAAFIEEPEEETLEVFYSLNQENTPEVGSLSSTESLKNLIQLSAINFYVLHEEEIIGFIICLREGSDYHSLNYKFFSNSEQKFLYIDRVVIKNSFRRKGAGTFLYNHLSSIAHKEKLPLCCEVNTIPKNTASLNFHEKNGFIETGGHNFEDHSVIYLKK